MSGRGRAAVDVWIGKCVKNLPAELGRLLVDLQRYRPRLLTHSYATLSNWPPSAVAISYWYRGLGVLWGEYLGGGDPCTSVGFSPPSV